MRAFGMVAIVVSVAGGVVACSSSSSFDAPADVSGAYSVTTTRHENGCNFDNWSVGTSDANIPVTITQTNSDASAKVEGLAGLFTALWLGTSQFTGTVSRSSMRLTAFGTANKVDRACSYTVDAVIEASVSGDHIDGTITYTDRTNGSPDCGTREGCSSVEAFNGTRPPK